MPGVALSIYRLTSQGRLLQCAAPSMPRAMRPVFKNIPIGKDVGSCGMAAWTGRQIRIDDISTDARWAAYRSLPLRNGFRGCWSRPIKSGPGSVSGTVGMYFRQPPRSVDAALDVLRDASRLAGLLFETGRQSDAIVGALPLVLSEHLEALGLDLMSAVSDAAVIRASRGNLQRAQLICRLMQDLQRLPTLGIHPKPVFAGLRDIAHDLGHAAGLEIEIAPNLEYSSALITEDTARLLFWCSVLQSCVFHLDEAPVPLVAFLEAGELHVQRREPRTWHLDDDFETAKLVQKAITHLAHLSGKTFKLGPQADTCSVRLEVAI